MKVGAVFVDLTAAYDTVWHRGLTCKLLRLLPDKHMVRMIMELVRNQSFTFTTGESKQSRLRRLKTAFLRDRSWLPSYLTSIPSMISRKFAYADDLALLHSSTYLYSYLHLPVLSGIQPAELCRMGATLSLAYRESLDPDHILYGLQILAK